MPAQRLVAQAFGLRQWPRKSSRWRSRPCGICKSATPSKVPAPVANRPPSSMPPSTSNPFRNDSANTSFFNPQGQFRYSFPLDDETTPKRLLDQVLTTTIPVLVRELIAVVHHLVPLWSFEAKIFRTGQSILGVLDSGSEIVTIVGTSILYLVVTAYLSIATLHHSYL